MGHVPRGLNPRLFSHPCSKSHLPHKLFLKCSKSLLLIHSQIRKRSTSQQQVSCSRRLWFSGKIHRCHVTVEINSFSVDGPRVRFPANAIKTVFPFCFCFYFPHRYSGVWKLSRVCIATQYFSISLVCGNWAGTAVPYSHNLQARQ